MPKNQSSNVRVVVRIRPENSYEKEGNYKIVVKEVDDYMLVFDPKENTETVMFGKGLAFKNRKRTILDRRVRDLRFAFDRVFNHACTNQELFEFATKSMVDSVLGGFNCSVFAYGATSAGKTHTMLGSPSQPGVIFHTMMELYKRIFELSDEYVCDISVSYLEIYNETVRDLLLPTGPLALREDPQKGVCVNGLSLHKPRNAEELLGMLEFGNQNRTQHPTDANKQSSRSHAVFQVFCRQEPKAAGLSANVKCSKMSLIDLAGSERATVTTNRGARFREGANINRSLLALGNCINALAENKAKSFIPYRDSKLTRLLKDSLGGNCKTLMIAAVSPSSMSYEDTYNTLKYASRAKNIKSQLSTNVISVDFHVSQYVKIIEELKNHNEELKKKVARFENGEATPIRVYRQELKQREQLDSEQEMTSVYKDRCLIRKQLIDCEAAQKEICIKLHRKERNLIERMEILCPATADEKEARTKFEQFQSASERKTSGLETKKLALLKTLEANGERLTRSQNESEALLEDSSAVNKDRFALFRECRVHELEKVSARAQADHYRRYAVLLEKASQSTDRLVTDLLTLVKKQHSALQQCDAITPDLMSDFDCLVGKIAGNRKLAWADETMNESLNVSSVLNFETCTPRKPSARALDVLQQSIRRNPTPLGACRDTLTPMRPSSENKDRRETMVLEQTANSLDSLRETDPTLTPGLTRHASPLSSPGDLSQTDSTHQDTTAEETNGTSVGQEDMNRTFTVDQTDLQATPKLPSVLGPNPRVITTPVVSVSQIPRLDTPSPKAQHAAAKQGSFPRSPKIDSPRLRSPREPPPKGAYRAGHAIEDPRSTLAKSFPLSNGYSMNNALTAASSSRSASGNTPSKQDLPKPLFDRTLLDASRRVAPLSESHAGGNEQRNLQTRDSFVKPTFKLQNRDRSTYMPRYATSTLAAQKKRKGNPLGPHTSSKHRRASKENRLSRGKSISQPDLAQLSLAKKDFSIRKFSLKKSHSQYNVNKI